MSLSKAATQKNQTPLELLAESLKPGMARVNEIILQKMQSEIPLIPQLAGHLIGGGGKRIRPLLTLASAALFGGGQGREHRLAACVEFIHTATLLHDDVVDNSDQRRGKASANALFGNEAAVLVGDFLFSRSFQLMVEDGSIDVLRILSNASAEIAEGEVLQLTTTRNIDTTVDEYLRVIAAKTAVLFAAACEVGAVVAGRSAEEQQALKNYGTSLGIAFQISDDVLDYAADEKTLGKSVGDDFREGKMTLPALIAIESATVEEKAFWQRTMGALEQRDGDLEQAIELMDKYNAFSRALDRARQVAAEAGQSLDILPPGDMRNWLAELAFYAVDRDK